MGGKEGEAETGEATEETATAEGETPRRRVIRREAGETLPPGEVQMSVAGDQGFGATGQQPDSVGDHAQAGKGAPVAGADGGSPDGKEPQSSPEQEKGAETVGAAS